MDRQTNSDGSKPRTVQGDLARLPTGLARRLSSQDYYWSSGVRPEPAGVWAPG